MEPEQRIRILVVDNHPAIQSGIRASVEPEPDMEVVGCAATRQEAVELHRHHRPDVTLMDLALEGGGGGLEAIQEIRAEYPAAKIVVFSALMGDEDIYQALRLGAVTFISKETSDSDLMRTIREVAAGGRPIPPDVATKLADRLTQPVLTPREVEVLSLVVAGLRNKEIACKLCISEQTAQGHVRNILAKLNVNDRTAAAIVAVRRGIVRLR